MAINVSDNNPRVNYTATSGQTVFTVSFEFFEETDLTVYINGTEKTLTTDYSVTGGDGSTGTITLVTGATVSDKVAIVRDVAMQRTTDFSAGQDINREALNEQLDKLTALVADIDDRASRALQLNDYEVATSVVLPDVNTRKGKVLGFNETTGAAQEGPEIADVETLAAVSADISTLADIEDGTDATDAIQTAASISSDITTVSGISSNVTTVAGISSDVTAVAADATDIGTVATNISSVNTVATNIADVITVANDLNEAVSEVVTVADDLNEAVSEIDTVAGSISNVDTVGTNIADVNTVAGSISNVNSVGGSISNVNTVATNLSSINDFADKYRIGATDPTTDLDEGDLFYNTTSDTLKIYTGSAWEAGVTAGSGFLALSGGTLTGNLLFSGSQTVDGRDLSVDGAKLDNIEANADVTDATNVQAAGALMDSEVTNLAQVKAFNSSDYATAAQGTTADAALPKAGGTMTGNLNHGDNVKAQFGTGNDLQIYFNGADGVINESVAGNLLIQGDNIYLQNSAASASYLRGVDGGAIDLRYAGNVKLATTSTGIDVTGAVAADSGDISGELIADSYNETYAAVTSSSNATTVDCHNGNAFSHTLTENTTFTFSNPPASGTAFTFSLEIIQDASASGYTVTWPSSVDWPSATAPTLTATASGKDVFVFYTRDGGTTFYGFTAGQALG